MVRDAGFDKARSAAEQNKFLFCNPSKKSAARNRKQKNFIFFWMMVRDAGFEPARRSEGT